MDLFDLIQVSPEGDGRTARGRIALFQERFGGNVNLYALYEGKSGRLRLLRAPLTAQVVSDHLDGVCGVGVRLQDGKRTGALVVAFVENADGGEFDEDRFNALLFLERANHHYGLAVHLERSRLGYHDWMLFPRAGVAAWKARRVARLILEELEIADAEIFPKPRASGSAASFVPAPLFGALVPKGRTLFIDPATLQPYTDQWGFLESAECVEESDLDQIIELNGLLRENEPSDKSPKTTPRRAQQGVGLPLFGQNRPLNNRFVQRGKPCEQ